MQQVSTGIINKYQDIAPKNVIDAIRSASARTGVDFAYMMEKASAESAFDTHASAKTSSAKGLYQFIDQTWLNTVAKHGYKHGIGHLARHISFSDKGYARVSDPKIKAEIMALREDPKTASMMAAEFASDNKDHLENKLNKEANATDLYIAHFLGAGGATKFLSAKTSNPDQKASDIFKNAAKANKAVFFDNKTGQARSLNQVYAFFDKKFSSSTADNHSKTSAPSTHAITTKHVPLTPFTHPPMPSTTSGAGNTQDAQGTVPTHTQTPVQKQQYSAYNSLMAAAASNSTNLSAQSGIISPITAHIMSEMITSFENRKPDDKKDNAGFWV